jgi:hypothetical protein
MAYFPHVRLHVRRFFSSNLSSAIVHRMLAFSLCCLFVFSSMVPTVSAATEMLASDSTGKLPGALATVDPAYAGARDASSSPSAASLQTTAPVAAPKSYKKEELTNKRTAFSDVTRNTDGTLTTRQYAAPKYFKQDGSWKTIDTTLVEDKNATDATNPVTKGFSALSTAFTDEKTFTVKQNGWQARFAPSDAAQGMLRVKKDGQQVGFKPVGAKAVTPVITTSKQDGKQLVNYYDLWPGVNVQYVVDGGSVKENIILKNEAATTSVAYAITGASLEAGKDPKGPAYVIKGALNNDFAITKLNLMLNNFGMETASAANLKQDYKDGKLTISVSKAYVQSLPDKAFPAVIDPGVYDSSASIFGNRQGGNYISFKSDGYVCYSNECNAYTGTLLDKNYDWRSWRSVIHSPYQDYVRGRQLDNARLHLKMRTNESFWTGTWDTKWIGASYSDCLGYDCFDGNLTRSAGIGGEGDIDVTDIYRTAQSRNKWDMWLHLRGEEWPGTTFKNFDPEGSYVQFTTREILPAPSVTSPVADQVYIDPQVSFSANPVTNPLGGAALQYQFCVSTGGGCNGAVMISNNETSPQWTIPDNLLEDGNSYFIQVRSYNPDSQGYSGYGPAVGFKIDARTGKDKTQTFDSLGPVDVDLATGNVATSNSSHTTSALGGSLGVSLDYNTPAKSRNGLVGEYYNTLDQSGAPALTRIDQQVNFAWRDGSPANGVVNQDNFSAKWSGYVTAPVTGDYNFGAIHDDDFSLTVNGQTVYNGVTCFNAPCYGSTIRLNAGQVVPILMTVRDIGGWASAKLFVKGPVTEQLIPTSWLQTGVRPTTQANGLTGRYYKDNGTHDFTNGENTLFMQRTDPLLSFSWGDGAAVPGGPADNFMTRWTGYLTVPTTGTYQLGSVSDDGTRITVGNANTLAYDKWRVDGNTELYGSDVFLTAGQSVPITVDYF